MVKYYRWVALSIVVLSLIIWFEPISSYILMIIVVIKSKSLIFIKTSFKKIWLYIKTLTVIKAIGVGIKRFIIDNYISKWISEYIIDPIKKPISSYIKFYLSLSIKEKIKKILLIIIPTSIFIYIGIVTDLLSHIFFYAEIKAIVIAFFKFLWLVGDKVFIWLYNIFVSSWLSPILQIFALAWIIEKIERLPLIGRPLKKFLQLIDSQFSGIFNSLEKLWYQYIEKHLNIRVKKIMKKIATKIDNKLEKIKHSSEIYLMKNFIDSYVKYRNSRKYFKDEIKLFLKNRDIKRFSLGDKKEFYNFHNSVKNDNINIIAFIDMGGRLPLSDIIIFESFATAGNDGNTNKTLSKDSFWVLNMSESIIDFIIGDKSYTIKPHKIRLINSNKHDFSKMYVKYNNGLLPIITLSNDIYIT